MERRVSTRRLGGSVFPGARSGVFHAPTGTGVLPGARSGVFLRADWDGRLSRRPERRVSTRRLGRASFQAPGAACFYAPNRRERILRAPIERRFAEGGLPSPLHSPLGRRLKDAAPVAPPHGRANTKSVEPARKSSVSGQSWGMRPATADPQPDGVAIYWRPATEYVMAEPRCPEPV